MGPLDKAGAHARVDVLVNVATEIMCPARRVYEHTFVAAKFDVAMTILLMRVLRLRDQHATLSTGRLAAFWSWEPCACTPRTSTTRKHVGEICLCLNQRFSGISQSRPTSSPTEVICVAGSPPYDALFGWLPD